MDTGPVYGYFGYAFDEVAESPSVIQRRVVLENFDSIRQALLDVAAGRASRIDTSRRASATWGQPWLTAHVLARHRRAPLMVDACPR